MVARPPSPRWPSSRTRPLPSASAPIGEINATVHNELGLAGALTDGVMRDPDDLPSRFPVIAGSIAPSHAFVHLTAPPSPSACSG
jgi:regulator of RNase E activity RraA